MNKGRRKALKALGGAGAVLAAQPYLSFPAIAQSQPLRIGIISPRAGIAGTIGECGLRGTQFAVERINAAGGIAGRRIELIVEEETAAAQWPKAGPLDLTSHVAPLKAAKPDLVFSSLLFADLPIFMKTAHGAGLMEGGCKFVFPAAGFQHTALKKAFTPEGMIFGHNTLYFDHPKASALQKQLVQDYEAKFNDYPQSDADPAYVAMKVYQAGVEAAQKAKNAWPSQEDIINAMEGVKVEALVGPERMRNAHIAEQTFYQGISTHKNRFDFPTLAEIDTMYSEQLQKPPGADFWKWIETAQIKL